MRSLAVRPRFVLLLLVAGTTAACSEYYIEPERLYPATYSSETLIVRPNPEVAMCGGSIDRLESFVPWLAARLPVGVEPSGPITYQLLAPEEIHGERRCPELAFACAKGGVVFSQEGLDLHEAAHAVRQLAYDWELVGPVILEEGLGALYTEQHFVDPIVRHLTTEDLRLTRGLDGFTEAHYPPAAHFMAYLHEQIGAHAVSEFLEAGSDIEALEDYDAAFSEVTGESWTDLLDGYAAYPQCPMWSLVHRPVECTADEAAVALSSAETHEFFFPAFGCDSPEAVGPMAGKVWGAVTVDVPLTVAEPTYDLTFSSTSTANVELQVMSCDGGCRSDHRYRMRSPSVSSRIELARGRNLMRFAIDAADTSDVRITLAAAP